MADQPQNQQSQTQTQTQQDMNLDEDQFFNKYKPTMSEEEFFNKYDNNRVQNTHNFWFQKGPYEGPGSDYWFQQSPLGRILSAFGQGAKDSWGQGEQTALGSEIKWEAEQKKSDQGLVYGFHTSVMRPAAAAIDALTHSVFSLGAGVAGAVGQTGEELTAAAKQEQEDFAETFPNHPELARTAAKILGAPFGAAGELLKGAASGAGLEGGLPGFPGTMDHVQVLQEARSKGVTGEGEAGYFKTVEPSPENIQARKEAAVMAGEPYGPITREEFLGPKLVPNQGEIARQIDPDLFKELDRLQTEQDNLRTSRDVITSKLTSEVTSRYEYLEQQKLRKSLEDIPSRLQGIDEQLRDLIPDVADAKRRGEELLNSDSSEGHAFRNLIQSQALEKALELQEQIKTALPPAPKDTVRFYHGGKGEPPDSGGGRWVTTDPIYARDFRRDGDKPNTVYYVDVPKGHPAEIAARAWDAIDEQSGTNAVGRYNHAEFPEELAKRMKSVESLIQDQQFNKAVKLQESKSKVINAYRDAADIIPVPEGKTDASSTNSGKSSAFAPKVPSPAEQIISVLPEYRGGLKDVKGGELKESGLNKNIMIDAVQKGFDAKFQDAPLYHSITHADQAQKAFDYLEANEKAAMEVAMGDREPPSGIHPEAILMALKEKAEAEGDVDMIQSLSQTRLGREASVMGQRLGLLRNLRENIDPTEIIKGIQGLWKEKGSEKITKTIEDIQDKIRENMVDLHAQIGDWLKSIECDY